MTCCKRSPPESSTKLKASTASASISPANHPAQSSGNKSKVTTETQRHRVFKEREHKTSDPVFQLSLPYRVSSVDNSVLPLAALITEILRLTSFLSSRPKCYRPAHLPF